MTRTSTVADKPRDAFVQYAMARQITVKNTPLPSSTLITMQNLVLQCQSIVVIRMSSVSDYVQVGYFRRQKYPIRRNFGTMT